MGGVFFVKFVIVIPFLVVVLKKPLPTPPSFSMEKVGGAFFFCLSLKAMPLGFVEDFYFLKFVSFCANFNSRV